MWARYSYKKTAISWIEIEMGFAFLNLPSKILKWIQSHSKKQPGPDPIFAPRSKKMTAKGQNETLNTLLVNLLLLYIVILY